MTDTLHNPSELEVDGDDVLGKLAGNTEPG
jgi:hypothetical protein